MSKTTTYIVSNNLELENRDSEYKYTPGSSTFEIPFSDIDDDILKIENPSAANGAVVTQVSSDNNNKKIIVTPGASVKTSGKSYSTVIKYNITYNQTDDKGNNITKVAYSKVIFAVSMLGDVSQCIMTAHNGKLRPDEYIGVHPENNDLESLVTKKSLISNLKEFGSQVSSKIGSASALSINYNLNGGHWDEGFEPRYTFVNSTGYTAKAPKRLGYVFAGWNVYPASGTEGTEPAEVDRLYSANATGAVIEVGTTQNITAYAQWTPIKYNVVFNNKDGEATINQIFTYGSNATASDITKPDAAAGYEFTNSYKIIGLNDQEVIYDVTKKLDRVYDLVKTDQETGTPTFTLDPIFAPKVYTINYNTDGGALETNSFSDTYTYGTSFVLPTPTRSGYSFNGWTATNTSNNFVQQRVISPSDLRNISASTLELKAVWTKNNYHFEFDTQGGILGTSGVVYIQPSKEYTITNPTREGYNFAGWEVDESKATCDKGASTTYKVITKDDINTDIILKAKWTPVQVHVKVEYWYESLNATRNPSSPAIISNTIYSLDHTENLSLGTNNQEAITDSALTIEGKNNSWQIKGYTGINISAYKAITAPTGFYYVDGNVSDNEKVNANGTTVIKLYFARNTAYYKINDRYDSQPNLDAADSVSDHIRGSYSCLYGQSITVHPLFDNNKPESGYTVDKSAETKIITASSSSNADTFVFTYTRKTFTVKFDLNGVGTYQNSQLKGDIYTTTCRYGNTIALPAINSFAYIQDSSWFLNGTQITPANSSITINGDSNIVRVPTLKNYTITLEVDNSDNWEYNGEKLTANRNISNITYDNFPYYLEQATKDGYVFSHWTYKTNLQNSYHTLGGNTLSEDIIKTTGVTNIFCKPEFVVEEPKIETISVTPGTNQLSLNITSNSVTNAIYCRVVKQNGSNGVGVGTKLKVSSSNTYILKTKGNANDNIFADLAKDSEILITPVQENSNKITATGKPWYGVITSTNGTTLTVDAYPIYGVLGRDTDTTYENATTSKDGLMSASDKEKLDGIKDGANKTTASTNTDNIIAKGNDATLDNTDAVSKTEVYDIGTVTPDDTSTQVATFKGKDTTYGKATNEKYGLVKLGDNEVLGPIRDGAKVYPVRATSSGNLGVYVPWTDNQTLPETKLAVAGTNNATTNAAVNSGTVYINTYDVKGGSSNNTGAISIEGADGISVTADNGGKIKIAGHKKPPILDTDNDKNSDDGNLVPKPDSTRTDLYLRADGKWYTPTNTQVTFTGRLKNNSGGNINTSDNRISGSVDDTQVVTSLVAGTSITLEHNKTTGALTIIGPSSSLETLAGTGLTKSDAATTRTIKLKSATYDTKNDLGATISGLGGIKVAMGGTKAFTYDWNSSNDAAPSITPSDSDVSVTVYQPNRANGKYYPVECTKDSAAVVCIPDAPSPFYKEGTSDNDKFTFAIEQYKVAYYWGAPIFAFTGDKNGPAFDSSLAAYNNIMNNNGGHAIGQDEIESITSSSFIGLTITCPSNVIFAQLDRPIYAPATPGYTMNGSIISTIAGDKQQISIQNSNPAIGFPADSITPDNPGYAFLKFATETKLDNNKNIISKSHTYNAIVKVWYEEANPRAGTTAGYRSEIII